jgi:hypothetical protein
MEWIGSIRPELHPHRKATKIKAFLTDLSLTELAGDTERDSILFVP